MNEQFFIIQQNIHKVRSYYRKYGLYQTVRYIVKRQSIRFVKVLYPVKFVHPVKLLYPVKLLLYPLRLLLHICFFLIQLPKLIKNKSIVFIFKFHPILFHFFFSYAHLIRKVYKPARILHNNRKKVIHVVASFEVGGSQRQIINLSENSDNGDFIHQPIEIFPEKNYLYRKGMALPFDRYVQGNFFSRMLGKWALNTSYRSNQLLQVYKLVRDFKTLRPDIVVGWGHEIAMISFVSASIARIPKIVFCIRTVNPNYYSYYNETKISGLLERAHRKMLPFSNGVIVNSTFLQSDYSEWINIPNDRIRICPNGIESHSFAPDEQLFYRDKIRKQYAIPEDAVVIMNIGRFSEEKGQMLLVQAYRKLMKKYSLEKIYLMLCGNGPTQSSVRHYTAQNTLKNVLFVGNVNTIHLYLCAGNIFVMSSDFEGMPNAMMEAMACGLPCISTNRTGILDIARDNLEALYIDVGSVDQLAEKLSYLIERPDERRRLGENARKRLKDFSIVKMVSTFNNHLEKMVNNCQ